MEQYCNTYVFSTYLPKDKFYLHRKVKFIAGSAQYVGTDRGSGETKPPLITSITIMPLASTKSEAISHKIGSRSNIYDQARVDGSRTDKQKNYGPETYSVARLQPTLAFLVTFEDHTNGATIMVPPCHQNTCP